MRLSLPSRLSRVNILLAVALVVTGLTSISTAPARAVVISDCAQTVGNASYLSVTVVGNYCVLKFTGGTTWTVPAGVTAVDVLAVGGGGAGGTTYHGAGGGGGGGQVIAQLSKPVSGTATIQIAAGGTPTADPGFTPGGNGGATSFTPSSGSAISALGGSGGASVTTNAVGSPSLTGYNGGGGSTWASYLSATNGSNGVGGYKGGASIGSGVDAGIQAGGGGAGSGGIGLSATSSNGGNGGLGISNSYLGSEMFYGGGGGGGKRTSSDGLAGSGGSGVGGSGGKLDNGSAATSNTGGGGGGAGGEFTGGAGGSGVVILRYTAIYVATYNYNSATGGNTVLTGNLTVGSTALTLPTPTKTGNRFMGWYAESGFTTSVGSGGASYTPTTSTSIYAKWLSTDATLSALALSTGSLGQTFTSGSTTYTATVPYTTTSTTVTATRTQSSATLQVSLNSGAYVSLTSAVASGSLALNVGTNTVTVLSTAQDGTTTSSYTITVTRDKGAQTITFGSLSGKTRDDVNFSISASASSSLIVAFTSSSNAICTVSGTTVSIVSLGTCTIYANQSGDANFLAATQASQSFLITTSTNTSLSRLVLTPGVLAPTFNTSTSTYKASVSGTVASVQIAATTSSAYATLTIGGSSISSGSAKTYSPTSGANPRITITVTSESGTSQNYYIDLTKVVTTGTTTIQKAPVTTPLPAPSPAAPRTKATTQKVKLPAPIISGLSISSVSVGSSVTITGSNFYKPVTLKIGSRTVTSFTVAPNATTITFIVPAGANTGVVEVSTPNGKTTSTTLTIMGISV